MDESQATRNLRDYLTMYNQFTQKCFNSCATNFNYRFMTHEEHTCVQKCANKLININHRLITVYMELNPLNKYKEQQEKVMKEMETKQIQDSQSQASLQETALQSNDQPSRSNLAYQVGETFDGVQIKNTATNSSGVHKEGEVR
ncbi:mitochondrial import inner membrane translocase subunit Tim10 B-like [Anneissia japonica]|uniref:mitochondrial import inner membrane translocase subunit Tim10 B-like n=1 Tax=Anneissia japonica TaxID=1529436 RepID=UPI00142593AC|nr:mitochondrial import inner membrane translocase subunit Tim10 B-like [Anneissia japonica]